MEENRDDCVSGRHLIALDGDSSWQVVGAQRDGAREILAPGLDQNRLAIPSRHRQSHHARAAPERFVRGAQLDPRRYRADLDAIRVFGAAFFQVVGHGDHEFAVARRVESNVAIRPAAIVISRNLAPVPGEDPDDRVERRADLTGEDANIVGLPLPGVKREKINIPRFFDHSVQCDRSRKRSGAIGGVVGLGLDRVAKRAEPKQVRIGRVAARIVR